MSTVIITLNHSTNESFATNINEDISIFLLTFVNLNL